MKHFFTYLLLLIAMTGFSQAINTFPYNEDFEGGPGGWVEDNTINGTWELNTPAADDIIGAASGVNAWVTNATGDYNNNDNSTVTSPEFDFTAAPNPAVLLNVWWNSEFSWDGTVLQSSIDSGATWQNVGAFGDPNNWYTDNSINAGPGGSQEGWTGRNSSGNGSGGWVPAVHSLTGLAGESSVFLRIAFASDGSVPDEGFAFDDVTVLADDVVFNANTFETVTRICTQDGNPDVIPFGVTSGNPSYVITDGANLILAFPGNMADFDPAPAGNCRVWAVETTGLLDTTLVGSDISTAVLSDSSFTIFSEYLEVIRLENNVEGGMVSEMGTGFTQVHTCSQDSVPDVIMFANTSTSMASYAYVITDKNNNILGFPPSNSADFDGAPADTCRVWGISYNGVLNSGLVGANAATAQLVEGCFELSSNYIEVVRWEDTVEGGMVSEAVNGATTISTCTQDGNPDLVPFTTTSSSSANYLYIITDDNNLILGASSAFVDFEVAPPGNCRVWGLSYNGVLDTTIAGMDVTTTEIVAGCFELSSNYVDVIRYNGNINGGTVAEMGTGNTLVNTCTQDGNADIVMFENTGSGSNYAYIITDDNNNILALPPSNMADFDPAPTGNCRVWGLAYDGVIDTSIVGQNAAMVDFGEGCFDLSGNYIEIARWENDVDAGTISESNGLDSVFVLVDGVADMVNFTNNGTSTSGTYAYVITDANDDILAVSPNASVDFDAAGAGVCHVYGLSYNGDLNMLMGMNVSAATFSDACFDLSSNWIVVSRSFPVGVIPVNPKTEFVNAFPSPTRSTIQFEGLDASDSYVAQVVNSLGAIVLEVAFDANESLDVAELNSGLYFVRIRNQNSTTSYNTKFVKQ